MITAVKNLFVKDRRLGSAQERRRYDLPLDQDAGTFFLVLLMGLMSFLAIMAMVFSLYLGNLTRHWSSGLENKLTIEIPPEQAQGDIRTLQEMAALKNRASEILANLPAVEKAETLEKDDIQELISPWLGDDVILEDIPVPGLIAVELNYSSPEVIDNITELLKSLDETIQIDTHEDWLASLLKLAGSVQFITTIVTVMIIFTTITAVAGAIRSRITVHKKDVELLHLMGASDTYITNQFVRHAFILSLKGACTGLFFAVTIFLFLGAFADTNELLPNIELSVFDYIILFLIPAFICFVASLTARITVLRALRLMP